MLQPLAGECRTTGGGTNQETAAARIAHLPDLIAHALEAEHGVEDIERDRWHGVRGIRRCSRLERSHGASLGDPLFEELPTLRLAIAQQQLRVDRLIALTERRIDAALLKEWIHAEGARLVWNDRHDLLADVRIAQQVSQQLGERHGGADWHGASGGKLGINRRLWRAPGHRMYDTRWERTAERGAALVDVLDLWAVWARVVVRGLGDLLVRDRQSESIAEGEEFCLRELLRLVRHIRRLNRWPE